MDGGAWYAAVHGVAKSRTRLSNFAFTFHFEALEKEMATHSSVLAWRIPGTGEPGGLLSMGSHRVIHDWSDLAAAAAAAGGSSPKNCWVKWTVSTTATSGGHAFSTLCCVLAVLSCFSPVWFYLTLWTVACQASLSKGFSRQEYWSGLPCPPPRDLPGTEIKPKSLMSLALVDKFLTTSATWETPLCTTWVHFPLGLWKRTVWETLSQDIHLGGWWDLESWEFRILVNIPLIITWSGTTGYKRNTRDQIRS